MLSRLLAKFFWDVYDFIWQTIAINLLCFISVFLIIPFPAVFAASVYFYSRISNDYEPSFRDFIQGFKEFFARALQLGIVFLVAIALLAYFIYFYTNPQIIPESYRLPAMFVAGLCFWALLFVLAMMLYAFPLLVVQNPPLLKILKRSVLLLLDNALLTAFVLLSLIIMWIIGCVLYVGPVIFLFSFSAAVLNSSLDTLMLKYEERHRILKESGSASATGRKPASWKEIKQEELRAKPDRYKRSWRDIFKPWEY